MAAGGRVNVTQGVREQMSAQLRIEPEAESYDWGLLTIIVTLLSVGVVMVFSASFPQGIYGFGNPYFFFFRQILALGVGIAALVFAARMPYEFWQRWSVPMMALTLALLIAVVAFGSETFGATRTFLNGRLQPSEPAKIAIVIYISTWLASKGTSIEDVRVGLAPFAVLLGIITLLLALQPDISTAFLIVATAFVMFFIAGARLRQLVIISVLGTITFWVTIQYSTYARGRIDRFLQSFNNPLQSEEWQVGQAAKALIEGGIFGVGLGNGQAKLPGHLPVSWSDNIFVVIGEEMGLLGTLTVILLFALLGYRGLRTALRAPDTFGAILATGITALFMLQALLNMAVAVVLSPPTGVTLPFISYGGSSLVSVLGGAGILLSISRTRRSARADKSTIGKPAYARLDFGWRNRGTRVPGAGGGGTTEPAAGSRPRTGRTPSQP